MTYCTQKAIFSILEKSKENNLSRINFASGIDKS